MIKLDEKQIGDVVERAGLKVKYLELLIRHFADDELISKDNEQEIVIDTLAKRLNWLTRLFACDEMACTWCKHWVTNNDDLFKACTECMSRCDDCEKHDECVCRVCKNNHSFEIDWDWMEELFEEVDHEENG